MHHENACQWRKKNIYVPQHGDANASCESNITHITRVTFKFVNKTLLVHNSCLCFKQLKFLFDLVADKYGLDGRMNPLAQMFELITGNVGCYLTFEGENNTNRI